MQYLIQLPGTHYRVFPVRVIELDMYELHLRMSIQHPEAKFRCPVELKTEVSDLSLFFLFQSPVEAVQALILFNVSVFYGVQEIEIEIV